MERGYSCHSKRIIVRKTVPVVRAWTRNTYYPLAHRPFPEQLGTLYLDAAAVDLTLFRQGSQTAQMELDVVQRALILTGIVPDSAQVGANVSLTGIATRPRTAVLFHQGGVERARVDDTAVARKSDIGPIAVPRLSPGRYDVSVEAGPAPERSLSLPFTVRPRPTPTPVGPQSKTAMLQFSRVTPFRLALIM